MEVKNIDKKKMVSMLVVVALVAGFVGYMLGSGSKGGSLGLGGGLSTSDKEKLEEVKKMFPQMPDSNYISGQVKSVSGKTITLNTPKSNPFDEAPTVRQVSVTSKTKIVRNENRSPEVVQKEQEAYQKKMASWKPGSSETPPTPPMYSVEKEISISDIKANDQISIEAATQVRMLEKFEAVKIIVQMSAALPPPPASTPLSTPTPPPAAPAPAQ